MRKVIDNCVGCTDLGLPCMGNSCPNRKTYVEFCDECDDHANYFIDGKSYCEDCATVYLSEIFNELEIDEKANVLDINIQRCL